MRFCSSAPSSLSSVLYNLPRPVARPLLANCVRARVGQSKNLSGLHSSSQTRQTEPDGRSDSQVAWPRTEDLFSREPACRPTPLIRNDLPSKCPGKKVAADEIARQRKLKSPFRFPRSSLSPSVLCSVGCRLDAAAARKCNALPSSLPPSRLPMNQEVQRRRQGRQRQRRQRERAEERERDEMWVRGREGVLRICT